jgi:hypothetical protein
VEKSQNGTPDCRLVLVNGFRISFMRVLAAKSYTELEGFGKLIFILLPAAGLFSRCLDQQAEWR